MAINSNPQTKNQTDPNMSPAVSPIDFTSPAWDGVFRISTFAAMVFGALGILAAFVSAWVGYKITDATQKKANLLIAQANADSAKAKADATEANSHLAQANASAETARNDAAQAQLATEILKSQLSWRTISLPLGNALVAALSGHPGKVEIGCISNDPESQYLAIQFVKVFTDAKWQVLTSSRTYPGALLFGIFVPDSTNPSVEEVRTAFSTHGVLFTKESVPVPPVSYGPVGETGAVLVMIGSKKPAF